MTSFEPAGLAQRLVRDGCKSRKIDISTIPTIEEREIEMRKRKKKVSEDLRKLWKEELDKINNYKQEEVSF